MKLTPVVTEDDVICNWPHYLAYLVELLNGKYELKAAQEDIRSFLNQNTEETTK